MLKNNGKIKCIMALSFLLSMMYSTISFAAGYPTDVTPPWGRLKIVDATMVNNINYVERAEVEVEVYATDDMCSDTEIQYYISTSEISDTEELADSSWKNYYSGVKETITLPNITTTNTIYAIFRDARGNTSLIYNGTNVQYTVVYNANGGTEAPEGVGTIAYHGMPFVVTNQTPKKEGYYFWGWSTDALATTPSYKQGDIIRASVFSGGSQTITLYAVWTTSLGGLPNLSDVANVGDYVNYPVYYDNVPTTGGTSYKSTYSGWRVISKDIDLDGNESIGTVNLVSAGVPLTYYSPSGGANTSVTALTTNFLTTAFDISANYRYRKTGFSPYKTLTETFTNKFTAMQDDGITPKVRAMKAEDIYGVTGHTSMSSGTAMDLANNKYQNLFVNGAYYWLASADNSNYLWRVGYDGYVNSSSRENGVRPVVSLKSNVLATGTDMVGAWNIEIVEK